MLAVLKFTFFNVILGLTDILTDLSTFFFLLEEDHVLWALLTAQWMVMPFLIHALDFIIRSATVQSSLLQGQRGKMEDGIDGVRHLRSPGSWLLQRSSHTSALRHGRPQPLEGKTPFQPQLRTSKLSISGLAKGTTDSL